MTKGVIMRTIPDNIRKFLFQNKIHFIAFILPPVFLLAAYALVGIYPFGDKSVLAIDFNSQYVYFYDYLRSVLSGQESLFYNWSGSPSGGFFGTFAYYIASPFVFLVLLFPKENITEGLLCMLLAKSACTGLTMSFFLRKHRKYSEFTSLLFSLVYAMSGYAVANTINPMWLDAVIALPLIAMGLERISRKRGFILYTVTLFLAIVANYYIGYMLCAFSGLYFIFLMASRKVTARKKKIGLFALSSASAVMMSCIMIVPAVFSLMNGKLDDGFDKIEFSECFGFMDWFFELFPTVYETQKGGGLPFIYCGMITVIFVVAYFVCKKFSARERIANGVLCFFLLFSMYFRPLNNLWHGGREPVWFENRFSFLLIFVLIIIAAKAFENIKLIDLRDIGGSILVLIGLFFIGIGFRTRGFKNEDYFGLISIAFLTIAEVCAILIKTKPKVLVRGAVITVVCAELFINMQSYIFDINEDFGYQERDNYAPTMSELREYVSEVKEKDSGFYRFEKTFHRSFNDNIGAGVYGISFSSSVYNLNVLELLRHMGVGQYNWHSQYVGSTMLTDDIFGIRYILSKKDSLVPYSEKDGIIYENLDALPVAFLADAGVIGSEIDEEDDPFTLQESFASALTGEKEKIFTRIKDAKCTLNNVSRIDNHYKEITKIFQSSVIYTITVPQSGAVYAYFPTDREYTCGLYVNGKFVKNYFNDFDLSSAYIGNYKKGDKVTVELKLLSEEAEFEEPVFCVCDNSALEAFNAKIAHNEVKKTGTCSLELTLSAEKDGAMFTSIPYEKGWSAYVDGKKSEIKTGVNGAFMCVEIPRGEHTIELVYVPQGFYTGLIISICGAALFAGMIVFRVVKRRKSVTEKSKAER